MIDAFFATLPFFLLLSIDLYPTIACLLSFSFVSPDVILALLFRRAKFLRGVQERDFCTVCTVLLIQECRKRTRAGNSKRMYFSSVQKHKSFTSSRSSFHKTWHSTNTVDPPTRPYMRRHFHPPKRHSEPRQPQDSAPTSPSPPSPLQSSPSLNHTLNITLFP